MRTIAVLLTVHNRKEKTLQCLCNLYRQEIPAGYGIDVYLTNDGCTDGTPEAVKEQFPQVHIVQGDGTLFWNRGMYTAWKEAAKKDYDYYLWLNDDTFVYVKMLQVLIRLSETKNDRAIIIGPTMNAVHTRTTYGGRLRNGCIPEPQGEPIRVDTFNGNIVLVPRMVYQQLGNLDYYFTHSKGDFDYGLRATKLGIEIFQAGEYLGECDVHPTLDKWCNPDIPFIQRWKMLHRPNGMPPKETFHLEKRHYGIAMAAFHWVTIYVRCMFPVLWKNRRHQDGGDSENHYGLSESGIQSL